MSSLCDCWQAWLVGPVSDPCVCSEEKKQADAWHAYQAYCLRHLGRTGRLGFRKLAATSAQLAPLELPLLSAPLCRRGKPPPFKPRGTAANTKHACCHPNSADPASVSRALCHRRAAAANGCGRPQVHEAPDALP